MIAVDTNILVRYAFSGFATMGRRLSTTASVLASGYNVMAI
jgi:hypothetical protein